MKHIRYEEKCPECGRFIGTRQPAENGLRHPYAVKLYGHKDESGQPCPGSGLVLYT